MKKVASRKKFFFLILIIVAIITLISLVRSQNILSSLGEKQNYRGKRISSFDPTGGNHDFITILPGQTAVLAEIKGPAAIDHLWMTIAGEAFYGRKIVLRIYWDGEDTPSVEAPIGDFFAVGHGLQRSLTSIPIIRSSEGRALNCYWYMPFRWSAKITVTNEGSRPVSSFYYQIDYRQLEDIRPDAPYFHAQYHQETPCEPGHNYLILEAVGQGHYVGCVLSVLQRSMGWWGEGDDMIYIDGEETPSIHGTGSEDYFSDAWGMREGNHLYYGCPLQEEDFLTGAKATVFRFHLPDPIPFFKSIRVTIEHGDNNDRSDYYSSVAYWYQTEPHKPFPPLPPVDKRLPFALETKDNFSLPLWAKIDTPDTQEITYQDKLSGTKLSAPRLIHFLTSYYDQSGQRFPAIGTEGTGQGYKAKLTLKAKWSDLYDLQIYYLKGPAYGNWNILKENPTKSESKSEPVSTETKNTETEQNKEKAVNKEKAEEQPVPQAQPKEPEFTVLGTINAYNPELIIDSVTLKNVELSENETNFILEAAGKETKSTGYDLAIIGCNLIPSQQNFALDWNIIGPFEAPDMSYLSVSFPPEQEIALNKSYSGKNNQPVVWKQIKASPSGYVALNQLLQPNEQAVAYGLTYLYSPDEKKVTLLLGSDDGVKLWVNDELVHTNPVYRGAYPDQDQVEAKLKSGWNKILIKVLQGSGGWGFYLRIPDPKGQYRWSSRPGK
ncbi:MAG: glycoside hydrolase family 172 protein [Candidatus Saccharicenans sp.]|nr:MAG: hypothetical protein C0168_04525 [Candidatus Aminicenantes bacterium]HEK85376.1 DUF2961 domain-containing protein [Candidatus Aminicenantes bacterium]